MIVEKQLLRQSFSRAAPRYDAVADFQREAGRRLMAACNPEYSPLHVLDAGCGTGHGLQLIAQRWPEASLLGLDFAAPMLARLPAGATALCGDIEQLPLADASVDLVWSSLAMQWCDTSRVIGEVHRVLRSGGHFALCTLGPATFVELRRAFAGVDRFRHTNDFIDIDTLRLTLEDAGLMSAKLQRVEMVRHYPDLRSLLASVRDLGANHVAASNRRPGLMGKAAWQRFAANYERMRTTAGLPLTYDTYFVLAKK